MTKFEANKYEHVFKSIMNSVRFLLSTYNLCKFDNVFFFIQYLLLPASLVFKVEDNVNLKKN